MDPDLWFGVLGPLEVRVGQRPVTVVGARQRLVLAALLLNANRTVGVPELIAAVWDGDPPETAWRQVQNSVSLLRRVLARHGATGVVHSDPEGYRVALDSPGSDVARFESLVAEGRRLARAQELAEAARVLRSALALWRGPALAGLPGSVMQREAVRLEELRLSTLEDCAEYELACGATGLVAELRSLVAANPLRERFAAALMLALYRDGRQADALAVYQQVAAALADELGIQPGPELRRRHEAVLRCESGLDAPSGDVEPTSPCPAQLPAVAAGFVGRTGQLQRLDAALRGEPGSRNTTVVISAIAGTAGIGKTTLAVHWANRVAADFPDGQLYVNLRGFDPSGVAVTPAEALRGFLDALNVPAQRIPEGLDARSALYRSLLAGRRVLVLLDNARDAAQVRPLLPGTPGCVVVVTSRNQLTSLVATEGATPVVLDLLTAAEARALLAQRLGSARVAAEPSAVDRIVAACARLPLALAIVSARAATYPESTLATLAGELTGTGRRLDALDGGDAAADVRAVFSWSYDRLSAGAARLFRLHGLHPGPDLAAPAAASLLGITVDEVRPLLAELTAAHLLTGGPSGRYTVHDLLRAYAAERAGVDDTEAERNAASRRTFDHYLHTAHAAALLLTPALDAIELPAIGPGVTPERLRDRAHAGDWFDAEYPVLLAAARLAAATGFGSYTGQLTWTVWAYLDRRGLWSDWIQAERLTLDSARRRGDRAAQARAHRGLTYAYSRTRWYEHAHVHGEQALALYEDLDDRVGQAHMHLNYASMLRWQARYIEAIDHAERAIELYRSTGRRSGEARAIRAAGAIHADLGDSHEAYGYCQRALVVHRDLGDAHHEAGTLLTLGDIELRGRGNYREAADCYRQAIALYQHSDDRYSIAWAINCLGDAHHAAGDRDATRTAWLDALSRLDQLRHSGAEIVRTKLRQLAPVP